MNETELTITGNLTADPELRFTPSGLAVANFTVASTPRKFDRDKNEWVDGETLFMRCSAWKNLAENIAASLQRGSRVVVKGTLSSRSYETKEGEKRTVTEMTATDVGASMANATVVIHKVSRDGGPTGGSRGGGSWASGGKPADDPWATPSPNQGGNRGGGGWGSGGWGGGNDEPPF